MQVHILVIKLFLKSSIKPKHYKPVCLCKLCNMHGMPTLKPKCSVLSVMYNWLRAFTANSMANTALLFFSLTVRN